MISAALRGVSKSLTGVRVLNGCNLALESNRIHALVGSGGSGKTLVMKMLATLLKPDEGEVWLFGERVDFDDPNRLRTLRSRIGMQFQNLALFDFLNVEENVGFPLSRAADIPPEEMKRRIEAALAAVGLQGTGGLKIRELSGGMQRRVAIARAAVSRPDLLLFDDPSGGLDPVTTSRMFALISDIHATTGCTVVIASHDLDRLARVAHVFHLVERGAVRFSGTLADACEHKDEFVRAFFGLIA